MFSIITTTYHGNPYIPRLIEMLEANTLALHAKYPQLEVEYLLINDSPWEALSLPQTDGLHFTCRVFDNPENYGIHKSRARGIALAAGELITMLDQDDEIADTFLLSQYELLGDKDAIVCNGFKETETESKPIYRDNLKMSLVNQKHFYLKAANQIVSPGQCLIRKSAIPQVWLDTPQAVNGSDDLFLWLLLLDQGVRFVKNPEMLYTHKQVGNNLSNSLEKMCNSDMEMCALLQEKKLLPKKDIRKRQRMCAYLKASGYKNLGSLRAAVRYADIVLAKLFAYYI